MSNLYTAEVNGFPTLTFCDERPLPDIEDDFEYEDNPVRISLEYNLDPYRPDRSFAESGKITFRSANKSEIARWATVAAVELARRQDERAYFDVRRTMTFLVPHLPLDWEDRRDNVGIH